MIVPSSRRKEMRELLHRSHLGSMMGRTRNTVYWPGINKDLKQIAASCDACQKTRPRNQKEPLKQHEEGQIAWEKMGLDFFLKLRDRHYLIIVDYFSNFIKVEHLTSTTTSHTIIRKLKQQFVRYVIPKLIISDNGSLQKSSRNLPIDGTSSTTHFRLDNPSPTAKQNQPRRS